MILNIDDLSKFYGDDEVKFIKTIIRTNDGVMGIVPANKMGSLMDLITYDLIPINIQKIYILGHFLDEITLEELEIFIKHLCDSRNMSPHDFEIITNYNIAELYSSQLYLMGANTRKVYYHINIKELNITFAHIDKSAFSATLTIKGCKKKFRYSIINYAFNYNKLEIIGLM